MGKKYKGVFESFVELSRIYPLAPEGDEKSTVTASEYDVQDFSSFVRRVYEQHDWNAYIEDDLRLLNREQITSCKLFKAAYEREFLQSTAIPLVALDVLAFELGLKIKVKFDQVPISFESLDHFDRLLLQSYRIIKPMTLSKISKKAWKKCLIPAGLKIQVEDLIAETAEKKFDTQTVDTTLPIIDRMTIITADGKRYECDRYCPHKGADMLGTTVEGTILVCPRHKWRFDLSQGGRCLNGKFACTVNAHPLEW